MQDGQQQSADLADLVDEPRETLSIEIKGHVDLSDKLQGAKLARHICALANSGGGYLVFGFDDDLVPVSLPRDLENHYHRDSVSRLVAMYLSPAFLCDVIFVMSSQGQRHPVVRVPVHGVVPICARIDGPPDSKGKPQGIVSPWVYVRTVGPNGPESAPISRPEDWEKLIRRCVLFDRTALLGLIEGVVTHASAPASSTETSIVDWHQTARKRYLSLLEKARTEWKVPLSENHYQLTYAVNRSGSETILESSLQSVLERANAQTRDLVWTGWSMFYLFSRPEIAAYFVPDDTDGRTHHGILEGSLLGERALETTLPDFWRVSCDGRVTLLRAYREDRGPYPGGGLQPGEWFRPFFLAREIAEIVRHASAMAANFESAQTVSFRCEWFGLEGRRIADPEADWSIERIARANHRLFSHEWPIADLTQRWPAIVSEICSHVARLFDPNFELSESWVRHISPKFRSL